MEFNRNFIIEYSLIRIVDLQVELQNFRNRSSIQKCAQNS